MAIRLGSALTLASALTALLSTSAGAVDVTGSTVSLAWAAASGPVSGYYVIVSRNGLPAKVESVTVERSKTLSGTVGDTLVVQVAAFGQDGVAGPVSPSSDPITFVASGGSGGTAPPPPDDGGGTTPPPPDPAPVAPVPGHDFNGDGTADLVVRSGSDVRIWAMQNGSVSSEVPLPAAPTGSRAVGSGDYDGNRTADLLWENPATGALTLWLLNGGAVVASGALDRSSLPAGEEWRVGGSGDVDGDGADDLLLFSRVKGEVEIWALAGAAVAARTRLSGHSGAWSVVALDDTDGDGMAEIVWVDEFRRALELRDPTASVPVALGGLSAGWRVRGAADLAGDGTAELLLQQTALGTSQAWALDDRGLLGSSNLPNALGLGALAGSGDFDGDGSEDVVWSDPSDGAVTLWLAASTAPTAVVVNRALPVGGEVVSGASSSDDSVFRDRFCSGDVDRNGAVNVHDFKSFKACVGQARTAACNYADMDSDGAVTNSADYPIFKLRYQGRRCGAW